MGLVLTCRSQCVVQNGCRMSHKHAKCYFVTHVWKANVARRSMLTNRVRKAADEGLASNTRTSILVPANTSSFLSSTPVTQTRNVRHIAKHANVVFSWNSNFCACVNLFSWLMRGAILETPPLPQETFVFNETWDSIMVFKMLRLRTVRKLKCKMYSVTCHKTQKRSKVIALLFL